MPHVPQWFGSVVVLTHEPPQLVVPPGQLVVQVPALHTWFAAHFVVQLPQWSWSLPVNTQSPLQSTAGGVVVVSHAAAHCAPSQTGVVP